MNATRAALAELVACSDEPAGRPTILERWANAWQDVREALAPVAWMHNDERCENFSIGAGMHQVISDKVREVWLKANPKQVEHYTIPLYRAALAQEPATPADDLVQHEMG